MVRGAKGLEEDRSQPNGVPAKSTSQGTAFGARGVAKNKARSLVPEYLPAAQRLPFKYLVSLEARRFTFRLHRKEKMALSLSRSAAFAVI